MLCTTVIPEDRYLYHAEFVLQDLFIVTVQMLHLVPAIELQDQDELPHVLAAQEEVNTEIITTAIKVHMLTEQLLHLLSHQDLAEIIPFL